MNPNERRVLLFIRLGLMGASLLAAMAALALRDRIDTTPDSTRIVEYAFLAQAAFSIVMLFVLRRMVALPQNEAKRVPLTIAAWGIAESAAVLGAVVVMLGGDVWYLVGGLLIYYVSGRTHPVADV